MIIDYNILSLCSHSPYPQSLRLPLPGLLPGRLSIHLPAASQVHIARLIALAPGCHPVAIGLGALPALLDLLHLPHIQVLQPSLELEGLGLCQGQIRLSLQPFCLPASCGCTGGGLLQGSGIPGKLLGGPLQGLATVAGGGAVHGRWFYGILLKTLQNVIERFILFFGYWYEAGF